MIISISTETAMEPPAIRISGGAHELGDGVASLALLSSAIVVEARL
jgi:hypothetical protein